MDKSTFADPKFIINGAMHDALRHDSAHKHVTGSADYIDDLPEPAGLLHGALGLSDRAHAEIVSMDLSEVEATPGRVARGLRRDLAARVDRGLGRCEILEPALELEAVEELAQLRVVARAEREVRVAMRQRAVGAHRQ